MDYEFNPLQWTRIFAVPASVAENNLKIASGEQLKVLLYISYNNDHHCKTEEISQKLGIAEETVEEEPAVEEPVVKKAFKLDLSKIDFADDIDDAVETVEETADEE